MKHEGYGWAFCLEQQSVGLFFLLPCETTMWRHDKFHTNTSSQISIQVNQQQAYMLSIKPSAPQQKASQWISSQLTDTCPHAVGLRGLLMWELGDRKRNYIWRVFFLFWGPFVCLSVPAAPVTWTFFSMFKFRNLREQQNAGLQF